MPIHHTADPHPDHVHNKQSCRDQPGELVVPIRINQNVVALAAAGLVLCSGATVTSPAARTDTERVNGRATAGRHRFPGRHTLSPARCEHRQRSVPERPAIRCMPASGFIPVQILPSESNNHLDAALGNGSVEQRTRPRVRETIKLCLIGLASLPGVIAILVTIAPSFGWTVVRLTTGSMTPSFPTGSPLAAHSVPATEVGGSAHPTWRTGHPPTTSISARPRRDRTLRTNQLGPLSGGFARRIRAIALTND